MEDIKYPIEMEVITPLSVGAGNDNEWTRGIDYVQKDQKVYILDIQKAIENGIDVERLTNLFLKYDEKGISQLLGNKLEMVSRYIFDSPVSTINSIKTFLRTQLFDKPVVAGSSLKGSIRSALFNYLRNNEQTNEEVFGDMNKGTDFMRFVRIADVEMPATKLVNTKIFNLRKEGNFWYGGWKHGGTRDGNSHTDGKYQPTGFNTLYECVTPGTKGIGSITLGGGAFDLMVHHTNASISHIEKKGELMSSDISLLFSVINDVTKSYLQKEKKFFETYPAERTDEILDNIDYLISLIPNDGSSCLLKMSVGVGFHSITGDWKYPDYDDTGYWKDSRNAGKKKYKSRKMSEYKGHLQLMGFVRLRRLTKDEAAQQEWYLQQEHQKKTEAILEPIRKAEAAKRHREEFEKKQKLAKAEKERRTKEYQKLMLLAQNYYNDGLLDKAIALLDEVASLCPDTQECRLLRERCIKAQSLEAFRRNEQETTAQKFNQPLSAVIKGKTSVGNLVGTTLKWLKVEGHTFGEVEYHAFLSEARQLPSREIPRMKNKRPELIRAIGEEATNRLLNEIGI